jgi:hypothetical protein
MKPSDHRLHASTLGVRQMPRLPTDALPAAEFLIRHLYRSIDVADGASFSAIAENEDPHGDNWFWNDDNSKSLEFLSRPEVWQRYPAEIAEVLRFVRSMCRGLYIFRRVSGPRLEPAGREGSIATYLHSLMRLKFDMSRGAVAAGVRFHDERTHDNLWLTGNRVEFVYRGRQFRLDVETAISNVDAVQEGHKLRLRHSSDLYFTPRWKSLRLGQLTYTYTFDACSMLIDVEVVLELEPGREVADVVLTVAHDALDYPFFTGIGADTQPTGNLLFSAKEEGLGLTRMDGAEYYSIRQGFISGDALAIHTVPRGPAHLAAVETEVRPAGKLYRAVATYHFPGPHHGGRLVAAEWKLITAGGFYNRVAEYVSLVREAVAARPVQQAAHDFSISYDYGVTINAFAKCFAVCASGRAAPPPGSSLDEMRSLFDLYLDYYFECYVNVHAQQPDAIFSREIAFVVLGVVTMYKATGADHYRHRLASLCEVLLDFEVRSADVAGNPASGFLMRLDSPRAAYVDCHSGALLALTQAARYISDPRLAAAIDRGLAGYVLETCRVDVGGPRKIDTVSTTMIDDHGTCRTENPFWNFKAGMTLRFFNALRQATDPALQAVAARHYDRIELFEFILRRQLERSIAEREDGMEIGSAEIVSTTNSETQPWVMLGLLGHPCD